jgi:hypothetical protein
MLLWKQMKAQAATQGEYLALLCGDTGFTYVRSAKQAEDLSLAWPREGLGPGDRVALHLRNGSAVGYGLEKVRHRSLANPSCFQFIREAAGRRTKGPSAQYQPLPYMHKCRPAKDRRCRAGTESIEV